MRILLFLFSLTLATSAMAETIHPLQRLIIKIRADHPTIEHMSGSQLLKEGGNPQNTIIFDVREKHEFDVSHISGAIRVDPAIWTSTFISRYAKQTNGKKVIFYCSVGIRSSRLASRVGSRLLTSGAAKVANLEGGIFLWHRSRYKMVNAKGRTNKVHTFNSYWGKLLEK